MQNFYSATRYFVFANGNEKERMNCWGDSKEKERGAYPTFSETRDSR